MDLVIENDDGWIVAVEVKAGGTHRREDARGLARLRDRLGDCFLGGVLVYTGERAAGVADRIYLVPLDSRWESLP